MDTKKRRVRPMGNNVSPYKEKIDKRKKYTKSTDPWRNPNKSNKLGRKIVPIEKRAGNNMVKGYVTYGLFKLFNEYCDKSGAGQSEAIRTMFKFFFALSEEKKDEVFLLDCMVYEKLKNDVMRQEKEITELKSLLKKNGISY